MGGKLPGFQYIIRKLKALLQTKTARQWDRILNRFLTHMKKQTLQFHFFSFKNDIEMVLLIYSVIKNKKSCNYLGHANMIIIQSYLFIISIFIIVLSIQIVPTFTSKNWPMHNLDLLKCFICSNSLVQFIVLACNHTICGQCYSSYTESSSNLVTVSCPCGIVTNLNKNKSNQRSSILFNTCSSMPNMKKKNSQILDQSSFTIFEQNSLGKTSKITNNDNQRVRGQKNQNITAYLLNQLGNQMKLMQLRYKRYLNEISRCYNKLIADLNRNYEKVMDEVFSKCKLRIQTSQITCLSTIQKYIQKIFKPQVQRKLIRISKQLSNFVETDSENIPSNVILNSNESNSKTKSIPKAKKFLSHGICKPDTHGYISTINKQKDSKMKKKGKKIESNKFLNSLQI